MKTATEIKLFFQPLEKHREQPTFKAIKISPTAILEALASNVSTMTLWWQMGAEKEESAAAGTRISSIGQAARGAAATGAGTR